MIDRIASYVKEKGLNIYSLSLMSDKGIEKRTLHQTYACCESYSVTKLVTSLAIGILTDKGLISLDDKLTDILKDQILGPYPQAWDRVTIRHALSHKMGLDKGVLDVDRDNTNEYNTNNYLQYILRYPPCYLPGSHYLYTDVPHYLLSRVISQITGSPADVLINNTMLTPMGFRQFAFSHCPQNYVIGSSGMYIRSDDMVKLGWLCLNYGLYDNKRIVSERWIRQSEEEAFSLSSVNNTAFIGKGGMNGQMVMYNRRHRIAVAWHGYEPTERDRELAVFIETLLEK